MWALVEKGELYGGFQNRLIANCSGATESGGRESW
jgi:hypothetical protein